MIKNYSCNKLGMYGNGETMAIMLDHRMHCLVRNYPWQVVKHSQGGIVPH